MNDDGTPCSNRLDSLAVSIAQELGSNATTVEEAKEDPLIIRYIEEGMDKANEESISRAAKVQVIVYCNSHDNEDDYDVFALKCPLCKKLHLMSN